MSKIKVLVPLFELNSGKERLTQLEAQLSTKIYNETGFTNFTMEVIQEMIFSWKATAYLALAVYWLCSYM